MSLNIFLCVLLISFPIINGKNFRAKIKEEVNECTIDKDLQKEIEEYRPIVNRIINEAVEGEFKGYVYKELATFVDKFGARLTGTATLEESIEYMVEKLTQLELDNVHTEMVRVPYWTRGEESAVMIAPRQQKLNMLGLWGSPPTPIYGITAPVIVVDSFTELYKKKSKVPGKIVVFNEKYTSYGETVEYRSMGMYRASMLGAAAVLIASITPFSIATPHTGQQYLSDKIEKIPSACITVEDARMLRRMADRGEEILITLKMLSRSYPDRMSRNTVAEIRGSQKPREVVLVSGHIDSWDVGEGAMDDGGGAFISWAALALLKRIELIPRRTIRCVLWTGEEQGLIGAEEYVEAHANETADFNLVMESDEGTFLPLGIEFEGSDNASCVIKEILKLLEPINATTLMKTKGVGSDIQVWSGKDVPLAALLNKNEKYFYYHHSDGDTMEVELPENLDRCLAVWTAVSYVAADLSINIPKR